MSNWKLIRPKAFTNILTNPSVETNKTGWNNAGTNTVTQSTAQSYFGYQSNLCTYQDNTTLLQSDALTFTAAEYVWQAWVYIPSGWDGGAVQLAIANLTSVVTNTATTTTTTADQWVQLLMTFTPDAGDLSGNVQVETASAPTAGKFIYVDGMTCGLGDRLVTHVDGDQPGCFWNGTPHGSTSTRIESDRRGGEVLDLSTDMYFVTTGGVGTGMPAVRNNFQPISQQGGAIFNGIRIQPRSFVLNGAFNVGASLAASVTNFHTRRRALLQALYSKPGTDIDDIPLPVLLRYEGGTESKEISVYYEGGLTNEPNGAGVVDPDQIRLLAPDPFFYDISRLAAVLDSNDTATFRHVFKRNGLVQNIAADTKTWNALGAPVATGSPVVLVRAVAEGDDYIYWGGDWLNWDSIALADYIVKWDKSAETYSAMVSTAADNTILDMVVHPGGDLYIAGAVANIDGVLVRGMARWDGTNWNALGPPSAQANCNTIAIGNDNNIYVGGSFVNLDGIANADAVAMWDGSSWNALDQGLDGTVNKIIILGDKLYAVGAFDNINGGAATSKIAIWDITKSSWSVAHSSTINNTVNDFVFDSRGNYYIAGDFTQIDSDANFSYVAYYNGQTFVALDGGLAGGVANALALDDDGDVWIGGAFTSAGSIGATLQNGLTIWNGASYAHPDIDGPSSVSITTQDLLIARNKDLYVASSETMVGTTAYAGIATISYTGSAEHYPTITIERSGGTSAKVVSIRNETTDATLWFDHDLIDNEKITIKTNPFNGTLIVSNLQGNLPNAILQNSDIGNFYLDPGNVTSKDNIISCFVTTAGGPTITALLFYRNTYLSQD